MALSAFVAFSALVGVSVALSNGTAPAPWAQAAARESSGATDSSGGATPGQPEEEPPRAGASLFALAPDPVHVPEFRSGVPAEGGAQALDGSGPGIVSVADLYGGRASSVAPAERAPAVFEGELPVNTIIAPAQPVTVLDGGQFGWRIAPDNGQRDFHNGTDISVPQNTPVVAALDGTVTAVFWDVWGGNRVELSHADGLKTTYNHMEHVMVREGDTLRASEQLGTAGQTGLRVTGPHLHFETYVNGQAVDAQSFDWRTGEAIIPASRPQHSLEDQAPVPQPPADAAARPGTDNGFLADVPPSEREHLVALSESTAPARDGSAAEPGSAGKAPSHGSGTAEPGTEKDKSLQAAGKPGTGGSTGGPGKGTGGKATPAHTAPPPKGPGAGKGPGTPSGTGKDAEKGKQPAKGKGDKPAAPGKGAGSGKDTAKDPAGTPGAGAGKDPAEKPGTGPAGQGHAGRPSGAQPSGPVTGNTGGGKPGSSSDQETPTEPGGGGGQSIKDPKPGTSGPDSGTGGPGAEDQGPGANGPKPDAGSPNPGTETQTPPQQSQLNPYTEPISQLTTLKQIQQRTQYLLTQHATLPVGQRWQAGSPLGLELPLLSQQLVTAKVDTQNPGFTAQLVAAQQAVAKASGAPTDKKLSGAADVELSKLTTLLAGTPPYTG